MGKSDGEEMMMYKIKRAVNFQKVYSSFYFNSTAAHNHKATGLLLYPMSSIR